MKPKVYIETSIPSYLAARPSNDLRAMANQNTTVDWWNNSRHKFDVFISEFVVAEAAQGHPEAARRRMAVITGIAELKVTEEARGLAKALISEGPIPEGSEQDPIVKETRKLREKYAARLRHDPDAIFRDIQKRQAESQSKVVSHPPRRPAIKRKCA